MTVQPLKIGRREFVLLAKSDFEKLAVQARGQSEDDYWTQSALDAEARARAGRHKPIPFKQIERELDVRKRPRNGRRPRHRR